MVPVPRQKQVGAKKATSSLCHPGLQDWRGLRGEKAWGGGNGRGNFQAVSYIWDQSKVLDVGHTAVRQGRVW